MLRSILLGVVGVLFLQVAAAQDVILLRNADEIQALVSEITDSEVKYRRFGDPEGLVRVLARGDVFLITYANGEKELFRTVVREDDYPYPRVSRAYRIGEFFDEGGVQGLVVATTDDGRHGLLLSLKEGNCLWGGAWGQEQTETFRGFECYCRSLDDGWVNMLALRDLIAHNQTLTWGNFPAFAWCRNLGPGWYLPSIAEISLLWNFGEANPAMSLREHTSAIIPLSALLLGSGGDRMYRIGCYWTSSEDGAAERARVWNYNPEKYKYQVKSRSALVRAVHKF